MHRTSKLKSLGFILTPFIVGKMYYFFCNTLRFREIIQCGRVVIPSREQEGVEDFKKYVVAIIKWDCFRISSGNTAEKS